jgi:hypothetical protein
LLASVVLAVGTSVTAVLPLADAYAERETLSASAHVEETGSKTCTPAHDELACQLCRVLRLSSSGGAQPFAGEWVAAPHGHPVAAAAVVASVRLAPGTAPRAPPIG